MDVETLKAQIDGHIDRITDPARQNDLRKQADAIYAQHQNSTDPAEKTRLAGELEAIRLEAEAAAPAQGAAPNSTAGGGNGGGGNGAGGNGAGGNGGGGSGGGGNEAGQFLTKGGFILVLLVTTLSFAFLFYFVERLVRRELSAVESVQFLIVLTLILSMLGFGGLLIIRAMFAPYGGEELQNRFRMGREIFLVFSGVFGTVIGFYFGSDDDDDTRGGAPTVEVAYEDGRVTAAIGGGSEPFTSIYTAPDETGGRLMDAEERVHTIEVGDTCPDGAEVTVIDGRGRRADAALECDGGGETDNTANAADNLAETTANNTTE